MDELVLIGRRHDGLAICAVDRAAGGAGTMLVRLTKGGLSAECRVYAHEDDGFGGLVDFFRALADSWRGWSGRRSWASLEGELAIAAIHDGHVRLTITLQRYTDWRASAEICIEPGEELSAIVRELAKLFT